ncbi:MAG: hypothetical protein JEZ06_15010 [Anaerolineaceae bacterium]|nr:hypothetical protein [Anaerolineaceae bacterium]
MNKTGLSEIPIIKQVDHLIIRVLNPNNLFNFLTNILQLPISWDITSDGNVTSCGVFVGNINFEIIQYKIPPKNIVSNAQFFGIAFLPHNFDRSLEELKTINFPHGPPIPYYDSLLPYQTDTTQEDQKSQRIKRWTLSVLGGLLERSSKPFYLGRTFSGNSKFSNLIGKVLNLVGKFPIFARFVQRKMGKSIFYITEYAHDIEKIYAERTLNFEEIKGGHLGIIKVKEIIIMTNLFDEKKKQWNKLLASSTSNEESVWQLNCGTSIRLLQGEEGKISSVLLQVKSLDQARSFLIENNILGAEKGDELIINKQIVDGLEIRIST